MRLEAESSAPVHGSEVQYAKRGSNMSELGRADRHLILISGAVASGKTTLALSLAGLARMRGIPAASIDIDELVVTVAGPDWSLVTRTDRLFACELAGVLTERLFDRGERLVAIAGSTLSSYEWQHVVSNLSQAPHATYVLLHVSLDEAVRRAQQDSTGPSRNLEIVARVHSDIDWSTVRRPDIEVDTDNVSPDEMAETVWRAVFNDLISAYHDRWLKKSRKKPPKRE
jgi:adenylylsulfate kinase-like enzyme